MNGTDKHYGEHEWLEALCQTLPKSSHSRRRPKVAKLYKELIKKCESFERVTELDFQGLDPSGWPGDPQGSQSRLQFYAWYTLGNASSREFIT